ncbi:BnaC03g41280D [Brassica napus]|uniref:BnaC03g41280D protein n=1 Tax=Brassica napus TaxID=3708 RepID=A0A078HCG3_BRANA|nr:BnaC03g41280D [Brassica napus]
MSTDGNSTAAAAVEKMFFCYQCNRLLRSFLPSLLRWVSRRTRRTKP